MAQVDVSVVVAVKNEECHIESALRSMLAQTGLNFEIIVVDDGSTDATFAIASRLAEGEPRLSLYRNRASGKCSAFNFGVSLARGDFTCIFAGDDIMPSGSLMARWQVVCRLPSDSPSVGLCKLTTMSEIKRLDGHVIPRGSGRGNLSGVSPLMNRLALARIFPVPEHLPNEDTWMELCLLHFSGLKIAHSDINGCNWRLHAGNSINFLVGFREYNRKITARLCAYKLFYDAHQDTLDAGAKRTLLAKIQCENARASGHLFGVLRSRVRLVDKLRAISITNSFFYEIRRRLYGLLSGW